jgi:type II secretory pathway pseudopilin PulG
VRSSPAAGFTLVEALVALVLSSIVMILVSTTFVVQSGYYASQHQSVGAHDNARAATDLMASEIRSVMVGGVLVAGARTVSVRAPFVLGAVCARAGSGLPMDVQSDGGRAALDTTEVAGFAVRDPVTAGWSYYNVPWATLRITGGIPASNCADNGADTTGAQSDFYRLRNLETYHTSGVAEGDVFMLFRQTTFRIDESVLEPGSLALFRQPYGGQAVEFATGMDTTARFRYRTGGATYADTVFAGSLDDIDVVRITADARKRAPTGGRDDVTFGWTVNVALRNVR